MADRLIDADALAEEIAKVKKCIHSENSDYLTGYISALSGVEGQIAYQPTVDAVPVVRCKDCKHYSKKRSTSYGGHYCEKMVEFVQPDDFCSYGERRTE